MNANANGRELYVDAGVGFLRLRGVDDHGERIFDTTVPSNDAARALRERHDIPANYGSGAQARIFITGKLAELAREALGGGRIFPPAAAAWLAARDLMRAEAADGAATLARVELSASGYLLVGVDRAGQLKDDLLLVNPRCGAGSGVNLDRVLQKLGMTRDAVDDLLHAYAGAAGRARRAQVTVRADRCGVFSSSATISDKNQGIPLEAALATTLKSEVLKACSRLPPGFDKVCLAGRVFRWRFARECAEDHLREQGVREIVCDADNTQILEALRGLVERRGAAALAQPEARLRRQSQAQTYPSFAELKRQLEGEHRWLRLGDATVHAHDLGGRPLHIGLDVGSTMAKAVVADAESGEILFLNAYSNAGDTIETLQRAWRDLRDAGAAVLSVRGIGITGSARFQVQQALEHVYPGLGGRVAVLVENYAHARGSIALAREHVQRLRDAGTAGVNADFCILVDIGGEDTKISTIALKEAELFNNAMNLKCSAGTGSLMDTLGALFGIDSVAAACAEAAAAAPAPAINATCAVFLMENARKLQLAGVPRGEILAAANWAIVENMARTLWPQVELPGHAVVLLHGQTMLSDPLPLAVTHRLQSWLDAPVYALVPPNPGHRACLGLIRTLEQTAAPGAAEIRLDGFLDTRFEKRIVQCRGAVCDDKSASCNRAQLSCRKEDGGKRLSFTLGGCSAVNELLAKKKDPARVQPVRDAYKEIWDFVDSRQPRSDDPRRLVIPRSFAVSEWAYFFARLFAGLGIPVHVDNVRAADLAAAQPLFNIDSCAPHMGAVGQYRRLAGEVHGMILAPQIEFLPTDGKSLGRTCTLNQGGVAVAMNLARLAHPAARFHLFNIDLGRLDAEEIRAQLQERLAPVFRHYGVAPGAAALHAAIGAALEAHLALRREAADRAADLAEEALDQGIPVALVLGREYILNPGIYDSHVRRLLRDKRMAALPSWVLDLELDTAWAHSYWRNPHFMLSLLDAVARRKLHRRLRHPRLAEVFRRIESGPELLPVVQVSTFICGPDSVTAPFVAEIMKRRPFLLIQSDAVIKELAHLENRVNTYVKQLELGLHDRLRIGDGAAFDVRTLDQIVHAGPIDRERDVICFPTLSDNRVLTAVLRGAGYACMDNYADGHDLQGLIKQGRKTAGDAVCAPLAAVWGDLERAVDDFARRRAAGDPRLAGKRRLLFFDNTGTGPCRQGQYVSVHQLLYQRRGAATPPRVEGAAGCPALPGQGALRFLVGHEAAGYDFGMDEWVLARAHQGVILQGVLHALLFAGGATCRDYEEYQRFLADYRALKEELFRSLESFRGPHPAGRALLRRLVGAPPLAALVRYFAYRLDGRDLKQSLRRFARKWPGIHQPAGRRVEIVLTGEAYMRVAQAEDIFHALLAELGFGRFHLDYAPIWSYVEFLLEAQILEDREALDRLRAGGGAAAATRACRARIREARALSFAMRHLVAAPLYRAAGLPLPPAAARMLHTTRELLPTQRPLSEIATYAGEAIDALRQGADLILNVAPSGCMVASMGEALTPAIAAAARGAQGRIQHLFSADGEVDAELLALALLKTLGPEPGNQPAAGSRAPAAVAPRSRIFFKRGTQGTN